MDLLTSRYRNLTVLVLAIVAQLLLLGYQVRSQQDVRLIRVWAVTAITPAARLLEGIRGGIASMLHSYVTLVDVQRENDRLRKELGELKLEGQYLRSELATAERARALSAFLPRTPSRMIAARIIGAGSGAGSRVVFVDRGSHDGVLRGMAVITPDGIVGKINAAYPTASQVVLITDPSFAAGVISQVHHVQGVVKGQGHGVCVVDYIQNEEILDIGEWFFTSGDDRVFPKGLPVGQVRIARDGRALKEVYVTPSGLRHGIEEVLIVIEGVHQPVPSPAEAEAVAPLLPLPEAAAGAGSELPAGPSGEPLSTDADRLRQRYQRIGEMQGHVFGEGVPGSTPPDFRLDPDEPAATAGPSSAPPPGAPPQ